MPIKKGDKRAEGAGRKKDPNLSDRRITVQPTREAMEVFESWDYGKRAAMVSAAIVSYQNSLSNKNAEIPPKV